MRKSGGGDAKFLLVGASPLVRAAVASLIAQAGYRLSGSDQVSTARTAMKRIREVPPDLLILLYDTAAKLGISLIEQIVAEQPDLPILVINPSPSDHEAMTIIRSHVTGYLGRKSTPEHLVQALRRILAGRNYVSPAIAEKLLFHLGSSGDRLDQTLSPRETQVLGLIARGKKRAEIAETLSLSPQTISSYRSRILEKLGLGTNAELIRYAVDNKLV
jgi:DNA-binding NarL/FixJ family response regulator